MPIKGEVVDVNLVLTFIARMQFIGGLLMAMALGLVLVTLATPLEFLELGITCGLVGSFVFALGMVSKDSLVPSTRRPLFRRFAKQYGFQYVGRDPTIDDLPFTATSGIRERTYWRDADRRHVTKGNWHGTDAHVFWMQWDESPYSPGSEDHTPQIEMNICATLLSGAMVPRIHLERSTLVTRVTRKLGMQDIQVDSAPFDRAFRVRSHDEDAAREFLGPDMQGWLLNSPNDYVYEIADGWILARCKGVACREDRQTTGRPT